VNAPEFALWTDEPALAAVAIASGVDCVGPDLEHIGKRLRQPEPTALISGHRIESLRALSRVVPAKNRFARCNPIGTGFAAEVESLIAYGVNTIMLPMVKRVEDVQLALQCIAGRTRLIVMIEQASLLDSMESLASIDEVHAFYVGTNDLSRSMGHRTRFGPIADGTLARIIEQLRSAQRRYGFFGLARDDAESNAPLPVSPRLTMASMVHFGATLFLFARSYEATPTAFGQRFSRSRAELEVLIKTPAAHLAVANQRFLVQCAALERR
jgi:2-keto-3-deoxy-L-rhamnonate aldolase RhmA